MIDPAAQFPVQPLDVAFIRELVTWVLSGLGVTAAGVMALMYRKSKLNVAAALDKDGIDELGRKNLRIAKLELELERMAIERNNATSALGGLQTEVRLVREMMVEASRLRTEESRRIADSLKDRQRELDDARRALTLAIEANTTITREGMAVAKNAFREANDVNRKIKDLGMQLSSTLVPAVLDPPPGTKIGEIYSTSHKAEALGKGDERDSE